MYPQCHLPADKAGKVLDRSRCDAGDTAVMENKPLLGFLAHSFDFPEGGLYLGLAAPVAVMCDSRILCNTFRAWEFLSMKRG